MVISQEVLRRALVIPTDRPLEACLAALPSPLEGLREKPFTTIPTSTLGFIPTYFGGVVAGTGVERKGRSTSPAKRLMSPRRGGTEKGRLEKGAISKGASGVRKPAPGSVSRRTPRKSGVKVR